MIVVDIGGIPISITHHGIRLQHTSGMADGVILHSFQWHGETKCRKIQAFGRQATQIAKRVLGGFGFFVGQSG
jgi:hypothetical protein